MQHQISAALSASAAALCILFPAYCLCVTPADAGASYISLYELLSDELPRAFQMFGKIPKAIFILLWLAVSAGQLSLMVFISPRWWLGMIQIAICTGMCALFGLWHIAIVHIPMLKLMNDLS